MKKKLVFATNNAHKLEEIRAILGDKLEILSLNDIDCHADIPETADTLEGNARLKAGYIYLNYGMDCFAEHAMPEAKDMTRKPTCANCFPKWKERKTAVPASAPPSASSKAAKNTSSKASCRATSSKHAAAPQASATTPSSSPKAMPRHLPKWETKKRIKSATAPVPCSSWWNTYALKTKMRHRCGCVNRFLTPNSSIGALSLLLKPQWKCKDSYRHDKEWHFTIQSLNNTVIGQSSYRMKSVCLFLIK